MVGVRFAELFEFGGSVPNIEPLPDGPLHQPINFVAVVLLFQSLDGYAT